MLLREAAKSSFLVVRQLSGGARGGGTKDGPRREKDFLSSKKPLTSRGRGVGPKRLLLQYDLKKSTTVTKENQNYREGQPMNPYSSHLLDGSTL